MTIVRRALGVVAACLGTTALAVSCASGPGTQASSELIPVTAPPNHSLTSYGAQFLATCTFSHTLDDDPIVHPGMPGASHEHEFFGNVATDASSTFDSLVNADSTCNDDGDRSAYWVPALYVDGKRIEPKRADAYYRVAQDVPLDSVKVYPNGLQAIAGDMHSTTMPDLQVAAWACGLGPKLAHEPPKNCTTDRPVQLRLTFPSCWDGTNVTSEDHASHLAYPGKRGCGGTHPVALPQLTLVVHYALSGDYSEARLASGGFETTHGDFFEGWEPDRIADQVRGCLNRGVTCGIVGGTFHTGRGTGDNDYYNRSDASYADAEADAPTPRSAPTTVAASSTMAEMHGN